jgi:HlyD family secretion protein
MDIPRPSQKKNRMLRRIVYGVLGLGGAAFVTVWLARLEPAAPGVDRATVWMDTVKRGEMLRQVRGPGSLVPEEVWWITAATDGQLERVLVQPGSAVEPDTVLLELSNPELQQLAQDSELQITAAVAEQVNLRVLLQSQLLDLEAASAALQADHEHARLQVEADEELGKKGLVSELNLKLSRLRAQQLGTRVKIEEKRMAISSQSVKAQLAVQEARLQQLRAAHDLRKGQVESLNVRAGIRGVLQQLPVQVGQRIMRGTTMAKVAQPDKLKAELRIAETQAKDVQIGQRASIDTRNGIVPGRVVRVDPAVREGTVVVDVELEGPLPKGARPDLSVDGTIEIERLEDVLYVGRPAYGQAGSVVGMFKVKAGTNEAVRVQVQLGRSSVHTIEVVAGLSPGDQVILSDTSAWDAFDRIRLD